MFLVDLAGLAEADIVSGLTIKIRIGKVYYENESNMITADAVVVQDVDLISELRASLQSGTQINLLAGLVVAGVAVHDRLQEQVAHLERIDDALRNTVGGCSRY